MNQLSLPPAQGEDEPDNAGPDLAALTRRMAAGDETAYRTFHELYVDRLWRYLLVVAAGDEEAAREALQAALVRVVRHIKVLSDKAVFWSWLTVLARSALTDQKRKRWRYLAFLDRFTQHVQAEHETAAESENDPGLLPLLDRCLSSLPAEERALIERKYFAPQSVRQIAQDLQTSEKAIESRLGRIRQKLKQIMLEQLKHEACE